MNPNITAIKLKITLELMYCSVRLVSCVSLGRA